MEEGIKYVQAALESGRTIEQVKQIFRDYGWQESQIEELMTQAVPNPAPETIEPAETEEATLPPEEEAPVVEESDAVTKPKKTKLWLYIALAVCVLIIGGSTAAYYLGYFEKMFSSGSKSATNNDQTLKYSGKGISFNYPNTWKLRDGSWIVSGDVKSEIKADSTDINRYFFKSQDLIDLQTSIDALPPGQLNSNGVATDQTSGQVFNLLSEAIYKAPVVIAYNLTSADSVEAAKNLVIENLKTVFGPDGDSSYDSSTVVNPDRIFTANIDGRAVFWANNGPKANPYIVVGVPLKDGAAQIIFNQTPGLDMLSDDQGLVYNSIKFE